MDTAKPLSFPARMPLAPGPYCRLRPRMTRESPIERKGP
jgi:hypothetical protein